MENYKLEITNEFPLEFKGELLFEASNSWINGQDRNRFHRLEIYKAQDSEGDYFIVWVEFKTYWQGEKSISEFFTAEDKDEIKSILETYNPIAYLIGYPDGEHYVDKQQRLETNLKFEWSSLKAKALIELGFKREVGRPSKGDRPRVSTTVTLDPKLKKLASDRGVNLSQLFNDVLADKANEEGWF